MNTTRLKQHTQLETSDRTACGLAARPVAGFGRPTVCFGTTRRRRPRLAQSGQNVRPRRHRGLRAIFWSAPIVTNWMNSLISSNFISSNFLKKTSSVNAQGLEYDADANTLGAFKKEEGRWVPKGLLTSNLPCGVHHFMAELWSTGDRVRIARQDAAFK